MMSGASVNIDDMASIAEVLNLLLYKAEKPSVRLSVRPSVRTFLVVSFSGVAAWIDVRLARRDGYVFWHDDIKLKSRLSVHPSALFWRSVSRPWLHGSTSDLLDAMAMSSGVTKFIFKSF